MVKTLNNKLLYSLNLFVLKNRARVDTFEMYNEWANQENAMLSPRDAFWVIEYIPKAQTIDEELLKETLEIDRKELALTSNNKYKLH